MKLEKIFIRNFRSVGEKGLELTFTPTCTTFIGENNVGKSSIFEAIKKSLEPNVGWDPEEWYSGNQNKTVEIQFAYKLDDNQINQVIGFLGLPLNASECRENFTDKLNYEFKKELNRMSTLFKLGELQIESNNTISIGEIDQTRGYSSLSLHEIIAQIKSQKGKKPIQVMKECLGNPYRRIDTGRNITENLLKLLRESIVVIEEFREKPHKTLSELWTSPKGRELASVLFNLKNARPEQRKKFEQIREKFHQLFPALELDVIKENNEIKILIQKAGIESTTFYLGAGILESLLILTHLIAHNDKVLCVDHPELHLHPHAQRRLGTFIEGANESQILSITHSPYFVNLNRSSSILRFIQKDAQTEVIELPQNYFTDEDFFKLEQILDIDTKEMFFARKVVLVEGQTELGALPIFASDIYNFDENGVTIIFVGGKKSFDIFVKLCEGFKIPYLVIADQDAEKETIKLKEKYPNCKSHILPDEFDDLLPEGLREEAKSVVGDKSKPRIGKYVAKKLVDRREIPNEISLIIEEVKNL
ncbi:MAG: AAA family ATPase [Candidatus Methanoperedens sp.]